MKWREGLIVNAKKCDRCGQFYEEREISSLQKVANALSNFCVPKKPLPIFSNDLCKGCEISLKRWWKGATDE